MNEGPVIVEQHGGKRWLRVALVVLLVVVLAALAGFLIWALTPLGPAPEAMAALEPDSAVSVTLEQFGWAFTPNAGDPIAGLVFYPGGRVDPRSYAPLARAFAEQGVLTVITPMPLNLAVFDSDKAAEVISAYPSIRVWAVGGHSLGGAMATQFLDRDEPDVDALLLLAAYPPGSTSLADDAVATLTARGTLDGLVEDSVVRDSLDQLPHDTRYTQIEGGNHAGFGDYGEQPGDNPATIASFEQQRQVTAVFIPMLREIALDGGN